ncbi:NADH:flavin oxidoreductase [Clostridium manihotivorum]|uniref:NADH oxidase n=1 Tax=Clostridium manihotivorum TaxID=2320868 RepID=A0A410DPK1_9CLOT|nr:NADH:flavin oxidoreductase [Clostridium manihotivorum]QAA30987.1 NADH oxidase [Clostridium manihotivorum]
MSVLLSSLKIGSLNLSNRLVMPPMATSKAGSDGELTEDIVNYYEEKSKGGYIGLIIIEHSYISKAGKASNHQLSISRDSDIEPLKKLAKTIQNNGSKAVMQINHAGGSTKEEVTGLTPEAPSAIENPYTKLVTKELSKEDIKKVIADFAEAARRVKEAGFDAVEIHSAHGYLLNQFYSPIFNKRTDEYGGDILNRIRIHLEVIKAVKEAVGHDFPVLLRLGALDYIDGGSQLEDAKIAAKEFEKAGVSILDISGGFRGFTVPDFNEQGYFYPVTEELKKIVSTPILLTGGVVDATAAEQLLESKKADLIGVGRPILKDSEWAKNAIESLQ